MRFLRALGTGVTTVTLALLLAACNGSDSSSDGQTSSATSAVPSKAAPKAPGKTATSTATSPSAQPSVTKDMRFTIDEVCSQLPASVVSEVIGQTVTPTDITSDLKATGDDPLQKRDPSLCTYNLPTKPHFVAIGVISDKESDWSYLRHRNQDRLTHEFGSGTEGINTGGTLYTIHDGNKVITLQGTLSGLREVTLKKLARKAVEIL